MKQALHSPWLTVTLAIVAMTIGYVMYLNQSGGIAAAGGYFCPTESVCTTAECLSEGCSGEGKCKHCPGCNKKA